MMKKILFLLTLAVFISCKKNEKSTLTTENQSITKEISTEPEVHTNLYGSWVGDFVAKEYNENAAFSYSNKINLQLKMINKNIVLGQSIVAGNIRPLSGLFSVENDSLKFELKEPGDDKNDGIFIFKTKGDTIVGTWQANKKVNVTVRSFKLIKKQFAYNPNLMLPTTVTADGDMSEDLYVDWQTRNPKNEDTYRAANEKAVTTINASIKKLDEETLKNLKKLDLEIIRNTIFARHGYSFKSKVQRQFFDHVDWYIPVSNNVDNELTPLEKENIALLQRFEKYVKDNYDYFGR